MWLHYANELRKSQSTPRLIGCECVSLGAGFKWGGFIAVQVDLFSITDLLTSYRVTPSDMRCETLIDYMHHLGWADRWDDGNFIDAPMNFATFHEGYLDYRHLGEWQVKDYLMLARETSHSITHNLKTPPIGVICAKARSWAGLFDPEAPDVIKVECFSIDHPCDLISTTLHEIGEYACVE